MKKRIIIGKNVDGYHYSIRQRIGNEWVVVDSMIKNAECRIMKILDAEITTLKHIDNLLFVKTNDDLVVIENYSQLNHDRVFKSFNDKVIRKTVNKKIMIKDLKLQKETNYKMAKIGSRVICCASIVAMLVIPSSIVTVGDIDDRIPKVETSVVIEQNDVLELMPNVIEDSYIEETPEEPQLSEEEALYLSNIEEYSEMFFIDEEKALEIIESNKEEVENEYVNEEVGIIRVLASHFHDDTSISKTPIVSDITPLEREKLIIQFAKVHGVSDVDTLATMLAVHRLETGKGTSPACIEKNNFGGLRARNRKTGKYYVMSFKTPEIGAEAMVRTFLNIKQKSLNSKNYKPNSSLEENMNKIYCGEDTWPSKVTDLKREVISEYNLNDYLKEEEKIKQLIK
jgi:hypothetical protein